MAMTTRSDPQLAFFLALVLLCLVSCNAQQQYENNRQLDCTTTDSSTLGYTCNGVRSCSSYLTFRSQIAYQSPVLIAYLLGADADNISRINGVATEFANVPNDQLVLVPVPCSCSGGYYQHNVSYTLTSRDTYFIVANDTYQGLSTCQALIAQNPYGSLNLTAGLRVDVPLRCACPTAEQTSSGIKYLLTYLITWGDDVPTIADRFHADYQAVLHANNISSSSTIYPFTTLLVPLETEPTKDEVASSPSAPPPPQTADTPPNDGSGSSSSGHKWVFVGVGIGVGLLALCCAGGLIWLLCYRQRRRRRIPVPDVPVPFKTAESSANYSELSDKRSGPPTSVSVQSVRSAIESLTVYEFRALEAATAAFGEDHRIMGSVYRGVINGDAAAIKRLKGDASNEINILKQINHSNVIRLSGFCLHDGNTYLVYEFAEKGSLGDWLHHHNKNDSSSCLGWKERVQIAHDVAHGLNYLHDYASPPYVHQNLKSSNILLDGELRAKLANFGLARPMEDGERPHLTRHVVGTQGYMAPEYLEHGLVTPKLDVFAFGVVLLELLSGKEATFTEEGEKQDTLLWACVGSVISGEDARGRLMAFVDPCLGRQYPLELAHAMAELAMLCVARDPGSRPSMTEVLVSLSAIHDSTLDWDSSDLADSSSMIHGR
ncbi:unnamed protein product [Musa acuminata subsp. malaccensis]|uniref:(wild Malaysian banana) hypothetical protein n=1 Tax=Musa acuminata subsp. malaccensis TaxID=214687 RepID=A0A804IMT3_MUSAM|nr:PREDICTED: protein LYK5 [Musa acuminata subsp. malaccensis]CAG1841659.1 unnamed protein product [Musa acuminata subsp. malaccensis]